MKQKHYCILIQQHAIFFVDLNSHKLTFSLASIQIAFDRIVGLLILIYETSCTANFQFLWYATHILYSHFIQLFVMVYKRYP